MPARVEDELGPVEYAGPVLIWLSMYPDEPDAPALPELPGKTTLLVGAAPVSDDVFPDEMDTATAAQTDRHQQIPKKLIHIVALQKGRCLR